MIQSTYIFKVIYRNDTYSIYIVVGEDTLLNALLELATRFTVNTAETARIEVCESINKTIWIYGKGEALRELLNFKKLDVVVRK